jgi:putative ABC transport system permease protein
MQRVAIARSLVNDPEIILADEPTGALDSVTSLQIMDILKEISKTKLVIMVTHNEDLADKYADRIITFKDGEITSDTKNNEPELKEKEKQYYDELQGKIINHLKVYDEKDKTQRKELKEEHKKEKTSMSFWTAFKLSLKNINSKKGRSILTAVAASFGIIGVALVLATNNGFNMYMNRIESETASSLPVSVSSYTITYQSYNAGDYNQSTTFPSDEEIYPYVNMNNDTNATVKYNSFTSKYLNYLDKLRDEDGLLNDYLVNYNSNYRYHLTTEFPAPIKEENGTSSTYQVVNTAASTGNINSFIGSVTGLPTTVFHELYGQEEYITQTYDVIAGDYPTAKNQFVLVVDNTNSISFSSLRRLGFYASSDEQEDVQDLASSKHVKPISWKDVLGKKYKIFPFDQYYDQVGLGDSGTAPYYYKAKLLNTDGSINNQAMYESDYGMECEIVGILRPKKTSTLSTMANGLCYTKELQDYMVSLNNNSNLAKNITSSWELKDGKTRTDVAKDLSALFKEEETANFTKNLNTLIGNDFDIHNFYWDSTMSVSSFMAYATYEGLSLIPDELKEISLQNMTEVSTYMLKAFLPSTSDSDFIKAIIGLSAYANTYSEINSLVIFPKDLTSKSSLLAALDSFNEIKQGDVNHASSKLEQVQYTDYVTEFTSSISQMITIISAVLIVFASISLVVSCVMTGIITYNSVIERTKEIGILRAIGARKKDVGRLFQAECVLIGAFSGLIGCLVSYFLTIPINQILNAIYPTYGLGSIATLNIYHVLVLVAISVLLSFLSGLLPARLAAKKDPVEALRSE